MYKRSLIIIFSLILSLSAFADSVSTKPVNLAPGDSLFHPSFYYYRPYLSIGGYYFTNDTHYGALGSLFLPLNNSPDNLFYAYEQGMDRDASVWEGNFYFGYRHLNAHAKRLYGAYLAYDRRRSLANNPFNQITLGAEAWFNRLFFGANIYMPVGRRQFNLGTVGESTTGDNGFENILFGHAFDVAMAGEDFSVGYEVIPRLTLYVGNYHFSKNNFPTIWGPFVRARYNLRLADHKKILGFIDSLGVESQLQYDSPRGANWYVGLRANILLGSNKRAEPADDSDLLTAHMTEPPLRDMDVVSQTHKQLELLKDGDGNPVKVKVVDNLSELQDALNTNNAAEIIAVQGDITDVDNLQINSGKTLVGGNYQFTQAGETYTAKLSNNGQLESRAGANLLKLEGNNTIENITLTMNGAATDAASNQAVYLDSGQDEVGNVVINGIKTNGRVVIERDGAAQTGDVVVKNSTINTGSWNASDTAAIDFEVSNGSTLSGDINNNTVTTQAKGIVVNIKGETLSGQMTKMQLQGVENNTVNSVENGISLTTQQPAGPGGHTAEMIINGVINNTVNSSDKSGIVVDNRSTGADIVIQAQGFHSNTATGGQHGILVDSVGVAAGILKGVTIYTEMDKGGSSQAELLNGVNTTSGSSTCTGDSDGGVCIPSNTDVEIKVFP